MNQIIIHENHKVGLGSTLGNTVPLPRWIVPAQNCGLSTAQIAERYVPSGCKYEIIDADKFDEYYKVGIGSTAMLFQEAVVGYDFDTKVSTFDLTLAKKVAHRKRRNRRYSRFAPYDQVVKTAIPGTTEAAEASRVGIRSTFAAMQTEIDNASTVNELYDILEKQPSIPKPPEADLSQYDDNFSLQA